MPKTRKKIMEFAPVRGGDDAQVRGRPLPTSRKSAKSILRALLIEIIDLLENPKLAQGDQILAIPTLVRKLPEPIKKIIGDLSNTEKVLVGLDLRPRS